MRAKVTDEFSKGFVEVMLIDASGQVTGKRFVAEDPGRKRERARRGDIVEVGAIEPESGQSKRIYFYVLPVVLLIIGIVLSGSYSLQERILSGVILGIMGFIIAWLVNRRARLMQRQVYHIIRIVQKAKDTYR